MNTSLSKGQIQLIKELHQKEGRKIHGLFIVEGEKMVDELLTSGFRIHCIYYTSNYTLQSNNSLITSVQIGQKEFDRISALKTPNKVLAVVYLPHNVPITSDKIVYGCQIKDPGNAGTILRTADWFGINNVIFSSNSVDIFSPKVVQASMGAIFRINCRYDDDKNIELLNLKRAGYYIYGADMQGKNLEKVEFNKQSVLVMGSESHGISNEIKNEIDQLITINKIGKAESLNVGVACGIICHKMTLK